VSHGDPSTSLERIRHVQGGPRRRDKLRALALRVASALFSHSHPWKGYRVTVERMREGGVGLALSVLYRPGEELGARYDAPPTTRYFAKLLEDLDDVESEVANDHGPNTIRVVHNRAELDRCLAAGATALVHCVEGGFHLGDTDKDVRDNVATLARRGVAYLTVAHLFFRDVATSAPALPFLRWDWVYNLLFPQPEEEGLTQRGEVAVRAMVDAGILIDISHMRPQAVEETFRLLNEELDPARAIPVIASHGGYRFGRQRYMLEKDALLELKRRDGVVGLIMAQYQLNNGIRWMRTWRFKQSLKVIFKHIDKIAEVTGSHRHVALGTDFDGFIKPTMTGLDNMSDLRRLEEALAKRYEPEEVELMTSENALRVLRTLWPK
jgi:microsomal dipeptidase-like Zn-dependent dipeptidase